MIAVIAGTAGAAASDADVERRVRQEMAPILAGGPGGAAVAVLIDGQTRFFNQGGADGRRPITADSLFPIGSVRKVMEVTLLAQAVLEGTMRLDDRLSRYVTELEGGGDVARITIGQIATHTSGLLLRPDYPPWPERITLDELIAMARDWKAEAEPGTRHTYTHAGFVLLQLALERALGAPIDQLLAHRVLEPLGMGSTMLPRDRLPTGLVSRAVQGYGANGEPAGVPGDGRGLYNIAGVGQVFSSARDLALLLAANLGQRPIDPLLQGALRLTQQGVFRIGPRVMQAMAWEVIDLGPTVIDKPAGVHNASSYVGFVPERKIGLAILANRGETHVYEIGRRLLPALARP